MTAMIHLVKLAVGVRDVAHLHTLQAERAAARRARGESPPLYHLTRNVPRRAAELLEGGSMYWVIAGVIRVRQRLVGIDAIADGDGLKRCRLALDDALVRTVPQPCRPFQGWRYLMPGDAPEDLPVGDDDREMPAEMAAELRALGLL